MVLVLTMTSGVRVGARFYLQPEKENRLGRGLDCDVVLTDPLASRVHAIITCKHGDWWISDCDSRNGTFVHGQKVGDDARLQEDCRIKIGSTEFRVESISANGVGGQASSAVLQTVVRDFAPDAVDLTARGLSALHELDRAEDLLNLYQLSIKLLGTTDPDEVVRIGLELLQERTHAAVAGYLWVSDDRRLKPKIVLPEEARDAADLSEDLTEMVLQKRRAVWIGHQFGGVTPDSLTDYADAICVPLAPGDMPVLGAIHLYRASSKFSDADFEFTLSLVNILAVALQRARQQASLQVAHERLVHKAAAFDELVGDSKPMHELKSRITRIAKAGGCVLLRGESGAGKELVARAIHKAGPRADRPLLCVNCAVIPHELMESQLFGHRKGAFTGADSDHEGWLQQANSGTLFLDEVGELTFEGQAKLLRVLEGHPFLPVGGTKEVRVDVRVIAATNRDLREFVRDRRFREDLYYRLSVFELYIPPLRDRGPDIELLARHFLDHFRNQHGRPTLDLSADAREKLLAYHWPGNVRQLRNVIDSAVVMAEGSEILPSDLGLRDAGVEQIDTLRIEVWEKKLIIEALRRTEGAVPEAAKLLGLGRATLYRKIEEYGVDRK